MRQIITSNPVLLDSNQRLPMKTLAVSVETPTICSAKRGGKCFNTCMVAEAIKLKFPDATHVYVDSSIIRFTHAGIRYWFLPPQSVKNHIALFDAGLPIKPFKFVATERARCVQAGFKGIYLLFDSPISAAHHHPQGYDAWRQARHQGTTS